jgi:ABC-type lipoprotein export system ATPase subunit
LDLETGKAIITLLLRLQKEYHMGIIVSTHDTQVADHMEETCILHNGKLKRS